MRKNLSDKINGGINMSLTDIQFQKSEWRKKSWSIPDLLGGKQEYFSLVKQLVELLRLGEVLASGDFRHSESD